VQKWCHENVQIYGLNWIKTATAAYHLVSAQPADYAEAAGTFSMGSIALNLSGVAIVNGDIDGRKLTIPSMTIEAAVAGSAAGVALVSADTLIYVDPLDALLNVTLAMQVQLPVWDIEFGAPV
jgi:hypothetical protein